MRGSRSRFLPVVLGFFALLTLLGGPGVGGSESSVSEANGAAGSVGVTDSSPGGDAYLAAKGAPRKGAWGRVRTPRTVYGFVALSTGAAVVLIRRRRSSLASGRPPLAASRRTGGVRAPPSLQPA